MGVLFYKMSGKANSLWDKAVNRLPMIFISRLTNCGHPKTWAAPATIAGSCPLVQGIKLLISG
jgi:hypothetical protein